MHLYGKRSRLKQTCIWTRLNLIGARLLGNFGCCWNRHWTALNKGPHSWSIFNVRGCLSDLRGVTYIELGQTKLEFQIGKHFATSCFSNLLKICIFQLLDKIFTFLAAAFIPAFDIHFNSPPSPLLTSSNYFSHWTAKSFLVDFFTLRKSNYYNSYILPVRFVTERKLAHFNSLFQF